MINRPKWTIFLLRYEAIPTPPDRPVTILRRLFDSYALAYCNRPSAAMGNTRMNGNNNVILLVYNIPSTEPSNRPKNSPRSLEQTAI